jgi:hypothetical protein
MYPSMFFSLKNLLTLSESSLLQLDEKYFVTPFSPRPNVCSFSVKDLKKIISIKL